MSYLLEAMGFSLCSRHTGPDVYSAFPTYAEEAWLHNLSLVEWPHNVSGSEPALCWPREPWGACDPGASWVLAQVLNAVSNLAILGAGLLSLLASDYSDEIGDLACAMTVVNGLGGCLAHATELRIFEELDLVSMLISGLLFFKGMLRALFPFVNSSAVFRTVVNLFLISLMFTAACWTSFNIPPVLYNYSELSRRWASDLVTPILWISMGGMTILVAVADPDFLKDLSSGRSGGQHESRSTTRRGGSIRRYLRGSTRCARTQTQHSESSSLASPGALDGALEGSSSAGATVAAPQTPPRAGRWSQRSVTRPISLSESSAARQRAHRELRRVMVAGTIVGLLAGACFFLDRWA
jgi:hypothetical protein